MIDLSTIPTNQLLLEISRRCARISGPSWAYPVLAAVAAEEEITLEALLDASHRTSACSFQRHLAMALLEQLHPERSLQEIGDIFGQDHGTVIHARRRLGDMRDTEPPTEAKWQRLIMHLGGDGHRRTAPRVRLSRAKPAAG